MTRLTELTYEPTDKQIEAMRTQFREAMEKFVVALEDGGFSGRDEIGGLYEHGSAIGIQFYAPDGVTCLRLTIEDFGS